jgi:hypothetical protein
LQKALVAGKSRNSESNKSRNIESIAQTTGSHNAESGIPTGGPIPGATCSLSARDWYLPAALSDSRHFVQKRCGGESCCARAATLSARIGEPLRSAFDAFTKGLVDRFTLAVPPDWRPNRPYCGAFPAWRYVDGFWTRHALVRPCNGRRRSRDWAPEILWRPKLSENVVEPETRDEQLA